MDAVKFVHVLFTLVFIHHACMQNMQPWGERLCVPEWSVCVPGGCNDCSAQANLLTHQTGSTFLSLVAVESYQLLS
eukprot:763182-Pelagomonas_calceolata.AAC.1